MSVNCANPSLTEICKIGKRPITEGLTPFHEAKVTFAWIHMNVENAFDEFIRYVLVRKLSRSINRREYIWYCIMLSYELLRVLVLGAI